MSHAGISAKRGSDRHTSEKGNRHLAGNRKLAMNGGAREK